MHAFIIGTEIFPLPARKSSKRFKDEADLHKATAHCRNNIISQRLRMFFNSMTSPIYQGQGAFRCGDFNRLLLTSMGDQLPVPMSPVQQAQMEMLGQFFILKRKHSRVEAFFSIFIFLSSPIPTILSNINIPSKPVI